MSGPTKTLSGLKRFEHIDAMRGVAAVGVVVAHCSNAAVGLPAWLASVLGAGGYGVQLFYVLSAYTLLFSWTSRGATELRPTRNFMLRRFLRIAPLYWVAVALYASSDTLSERFWAPHGVTWDAVVGNVLLIHGWHPSYINGVVHGGWSVGIEFSFYMLFPWLAARLKNFWQCLAWAVVFSVVAGPGAYVLAGASMRVFGPGANPLWVPYFQFWLPSQMCSFLLGFACFHWVNARSAPASPPRETPRLMPWVLLIGGTWILLGLPFADSRLLAKHTLAGGALSLIFIAVCLHRYGIFVNRFFIYCGKISYSTYLLHIAVLKSVEKWVVPHLLSSSSSPVVHFIVIFSLTLGFTIGVASLTYAIIEKPFINLGNRLIKAWEEREKNVSLGSTPAL